MESFGSRRHPLVLPLVLSLAMVLIVVAGIVAVVSLRSDAEPASGDTLTGHPASPSASVSPSPSPVVADQCVIGVWQVVKYRYRFEFNNGTQSDYVGSGGVVTLRADGTGEDDFSAGVDLLHSLQGHTFRITITGKIIYRYRTAENRLVQTDVVANGSMRVYDNDKLLATEPLKASAEPLNYVCAGSTLRIEDTKSTIEYRRS